MYKANYNFLIQYTYPSARYVLDTDYRFIFKVKVRYRLF